MLRAGAQPNINGKEYSNLMLPIPSINEQKNIFKILTAVDDEIKNEMYHKQNLETLKISLMQILLTGKVRVKLH
jgi:type I restriction enzyme S subunit